MVITMPKLYVSSVIGNEYNNWKPGDSVLITSQTGSGKSSFVLHTLLPRAIAAGKHIVYICNRKILQEQFTVLSSTHLSELLGTNVSIPDESLPFIHIVSYQYCESAKQFPDFKITPKLPKMSRKEKIIKGMQGKLPRAIQLNSRDIMYYIFDEAHYFIADASFNAQTNYWYKEKDQCSNENFQNSIYVFLTATSEPLTCFLACRKNPNWIFPAGIIAALEQRSNLRKSLSEPKTIKSTPGRSCFDIDLPSMRSINDRCREIQPFKEPIEQLRLFIVQGGKSTLNQFVYTLPSDYSYLTVFYFSYYIQLISTILSSKEKWLIFVDNEKDGIDLAGRLNQEDHTAIFLSAKTKSAKQSVEYSEFRRIVNDQKFDCQVLIATSVLDCGVNIVDPNVKNIVIGHSEKTTFLQMLGRKRIQDNETVTLYIKAFEAKTINTLRYNCEEKIQFMLYFSLLNAVDYDRIKKPTANDDGMMPRTLLSAEKINQIVQLLPHNSALVWSPKPVAAPVFRQYGNIHSTRSHHILSEYEYSHTALIGLLYSLSNYQEAVEEHRQSQDPAFYLRRQLSWINQWYDETLWVGYQESLAKISQYLCNHSGIWLNKSQQIEFTQGIVPLFDNHPVPISEIKHTCSNYKKDHKKLPGKKKINDILSRLGLPYTITAKQMPSMNRQTHWKICQK